MIRARRFNFSWPARLLITCGLFAAARMRAVLQRQLFELSLVKVFAINLRTRQGAGRADALTAIGFDRLGDFPALMLTGFICSLLSREVMRDLRSVFRCRYSCERKHQP